MTIQIDGDVIIVMPSCGSRYTTHMLLVEYCTGRDNLIQQLEKLNEFTVFP
jgi:hypothetical protein